MSLGDEWLAILDDKARERTAMHVNHASHNPLTEGHDKISLIGEAQFACDFELPLDWKRRPGGDGGVDFVLPLRFTVDVKTARKPLYLIVEEGQVKASIYVLAGISDDDRRAEMLGWETRSTLLRAPVRDFGKGIISHYIAREDLRPMVELHRRTMKLK